MHPPTIKVEIIHIEGPLMGTILEFYDTPIAIGRHPDCQVNFPKDMNVISRRHADIVREGNRFKIIDHSTNHTLVNGKIIEEAYLKDGDVMTISEGGPKISFISTVLTADEAASYLQNSQQHREEPPPAPPEPATTSSPPPDLPVRPHYPEEEKPKEPSPAPRPFLDPNQILKENVSEKASSDGAGRYSPSGPVIETTRNPLIIQFGAVIKSFDNLPVTIGSSAECEFVLNHPAITARHLQIFFSEQNYHAKDLTGRSLVLINGVAIKDAAILSAQSYLALSESGPYFQFLGEGRLVEAESVSPPMTADNNTNTASSDNSDTKKGTGKSIWPFKS